MAEMETHHQAPQLDTAQRRAAKVALQGKLTQLLIDHLTYEERELWLESVDEYKQQARREALEEAAKVARYTFEKWGCCTDADDVIGAIDRLREGREGLGGGIHTLRSCSIGRASVSGWAWSYIYRTTGR